MTTAVSPPAKPAQSRVEFIAMIAMMFATIALSIDAMLPALSLIGQELSPEDANRAQLVIGVFVAAMGIGTFFTGPISDAVGRKPVVITGFAVYGIGALLAFISQTMEMLLVSRFLMGLGVSAPRVVAMAITRDLYAGRDMAKIISLAMLFFTLVPAFAPLFGAAIMAVADWRFIFLSFVGFAIVIPSWMTLRLPEPLPKDKRRPFRLNLLMEALREMAAHPAVRLATVAVTLVFGMLFTLIVSIQPVYEQVFDRAESFPIWFMLAALISGLGSILNASIVGWLGMRRVVTLSLSLQACVSVVTFTLSFFEMGEAMFYIFFVWQVSVFFMIGLTLGNLNSIALEPLGHIAGAAASVIGGISTVLAASMGATVGQMFNGTILPMVGSILVAGLLSLVALRALAQIENRS